MLAAGVKIAIFAVIYNLYMYTNKDIWKVSYPILLGLLAQNVINVTDTAFLGRVGEVELGASAMGGLLYICVYIIAYGFSTGSQILMARRNGEGRYREVGPIMIQGSAFLLLLATFIFALFQVFTEPIVRLIVSSDAIYEQTCVYMDWRIWGFFFSFLIVMFRALYIGITKTKVLTVNAFLMAIVNIVLDYGLVFGKLGLPEWGIKGAAVASVCAEAFSLLFLVVYTFLKVDGKKYGWDRGFHLNMTLLGRILSISSFTMLQYFLSMGIWFVFFMALERLGQRQLAIANIVRSIYVILLIPVQALSTTANSLVSNLIGSGGVQHVMQLIRRISLMSLSIVALCVVFMMLCPRLWLSIYTNEEALLVESVPSIYVIGIAMLISSVANIYFSGVSGTGNTQAALYLESAILVIYGLYIFGIAWWLRAPVSICFTTELVYYSLMLAASLIYLKKAKWQNKKI